MLAHPGHDPRNAPVPTEAVAVVFSDFHEPACGKVNQLLDQLAEVRHLQLQRVFKHAPVKPEAWPAHEAVMAAGAQGKFMGMHDALFARKREGVELLETMARELGLDLERFSRDLKEHRFAPGVRRDLLEARAIGVTTVPTVFLNGVRLDGIEALETYVKTVSRVPVEKPAEPPGPAKQAGTR
jgi:predicted DsbA family dithiol-disulfide isomerase